MPSAICSSWSAIEAASARPRTPAMSAARSAQQPQVARADGPARAGEQGEHRGVGGDVVEERQRATTSATSGSRISPERPDALHRDAAGASAS